MDALPFHRIGPAVPRTPVVIAVPHAGRHYPAALADAVRVPIDRLVALEDRHADALPAQAVAAGATVIVADTARAWIDLNRGPDEIDGAMIDPPIAPGAGGDGPRIRAGLGLIPRRIAAVGEIWKGPIAAADLRSRIATVHEPYHRAVADMLAAARAVHGSAILLDLHTMPPLGGRDRGTTVVVGDLGGGSAAAAVTAAAMDAARDAGHRVGRNRPYAGGYGVGGHGRPAAGVHAVQIELCRTLYLDPGLRAPGGGLDRTRRLVASLYAALSGVFPAAVPVAAE